MKETTSTTFGLTVGNPQSLPFSLNLPTIFIPKTLGFNWMTRISDLVPWCRTNIGSNRITAQEPGEAQDDTLEALGHIGIMNLENAMEVQVLSFRNFLSNSGFSHYSVHKKNCPEMLIDVLPEGNRKV